MEVECRESTEDAWSSRRVHAEPHPDELTFRDEDIELLAGHCGSELLGGGQSIACFEERFRRIVHRFSMEAGARLDGGATTRLGMKTRLWMKNPG
jgi:hypothetical protein